MLIQTPEGILVEVADEAPNLIEVDGILVEVGEEDEEEDEESE